MNTSSLRPRLRYFLLPLVMLGCGAASDDTSVSQLSSGSELVLTNCTGSAISAAVAAGGDVALDCGAAPVVIEVPATSVSVPTRLRALRPNTITLVHMGRLFAVTNSANFEVMDLAFQPRTISGMAMHVVSGSATVVRSTFSTYGNTFVLSVHGQARLTVIGSTFTSNGSASGFFASPIYNEGSTLEVTDSTFRSNLSGGSGGAITVVGGGALSVSGSTFVGNSARSGGAIYISGPAGVQTVTNSTFVNNRGNGNGAAITSIGAQVATIQSCTFSDNSGPKGTLFGNLQLFNSIIQDRVSPSPTCMAGGNGNIQWPLTLPLCGAGYRYGNPVLGALANNGGPTQTLALGFGSAATDRATTATPAFDQRGVPRPRDGDGNGSFIADIGAVER